MFTNSFINTFRKLDQITELAKPKDLLVLAPDRQIAEEVKQNIIDTADSLHGDGTGRMARSIGVRRMGDGDYAVTGIDYAKYVNGRDRENFGGVGFIDEAVEATRRDFDLDINDIDVLV